MAKDTVALRALTKKPWWPRLSAAEIAALALVLVAVCGTVLLPSVIVEPYRDVLAADDVPALKKRVLDEQLAPELRERALKHLGEKAGTDTALVTAFEALKSPADSRTPAGRKFLAYMAAHPRPALAGDVLRAWEDGRIPDDFWRHARDGFLRNGWAPVCGWIAVPMLETTAPTDRRMLWIADVLARGDETPHRVAVDGSLARRSTPRIFFDLVNRHFAEVAPGKLMAELELRYIRNLAELPVYLGSSVVDVLKRIVASRRLPAVSATDDLRSQYAAAVFAGLRRYLSSDEFLAFAADIASAPAQADAYGPFAANHLEK